MCLFGGVLSLCRMVLQLRNSWQAAKISSAAVWWPVILMSHGFTVKEFMKSCQDFKCSCLVGNHPCVAWFYSWGKHDKLSKFQVLVAYHLSLAWCNSWVIHDMLSRFQVRLFVAYHRYVPWFYSWVIDDKLSRFQVWLFGGLSSLCRMVLQLRNSWQAVKISSVAVW